jgi:hypothetical protein
MPEPGCSEDFRTIHMYPKDFRPALAAGCGIGRRLISDADRSLEGKPCS